MLSDGKANVTIDGVGGRTQAKQMLCNGPSNGRTMDSPPFGLTPLCNPLAKRKNLPM